jgi:hypothetical protein
MMTNSPSSVFTPNYHCPDCGSQDGFRSRRRTLTERLILPVLLLRPVRCGECFRRDYRWMFTRVYERLSDAPKIKPGKQTATSRRNVA